MAAGHTAGRAGQGQSFLSGSAQQLQPLHSQDSPLSVALSPYPCITGKLEGGDS